MGYTTDFEGRFEVTPALSETHRLYLEQFAGTRRMRRNPFATENRPDPIRQAAGLPVGEDGAYFVGEEGHAGQGVGFGSKIEDVLDYNRPPADQPGLWCQWAPTEDGGAIEWDGGEKFYDYVAWIEYLVKHFLGPWGYKLNGMVEWQGEDSDDRGRIVIADNAVSTKTAKVIWED